MTASSATRRLLPCAMRLLLLAAAAAALMPRAAAVVTCTTCSSYGGVCATFSCGCDPIRAGNYRFMMTFNAVCKPYRSWACCVRGSNENIACTLNRCLTQTNGTGNSDEDQQGNDYCSGDPGGVIYSVPDTEQFVSFYIHDGINAGNYTNAMAPCGGGGGGSCGTPGVRRQRMDARAHAELLMQHGSTRTAVCMQVC
jgi:hypothetical protein